MALKLHNATKCASWLKRQEDACKTSCQWGPSFFCSCTSLISCSGWKPTNWCHRSLAGAEFHRPLAVSQQQHHCCNRKKGFSLVLRSSVHVPCPKEGWTADMAEHAKVVTVVEITLHKLGSEVYANSMEIPRQFRCDWLQVVGMQCLQFHILPQHIWAHFPVLPLGWDTTETLR